MSSTGHLVALPSSVAHFSGALILTSRARRPSGWLLCLGLLWPMQSAAAQAAPQPADSDSVAAGPRFHQKAIRPWHAAVALGGIAAISLLDQPIHHASQQRNDSKDDAAGIFRHFGQPEVYVTVGLGTIATGLIAGNNRITMAGVRISSAVLLAGGTTVIIKRIVGRWRPYQTDHAWQFSPFDKDYDAFPSGHTSVAFALATSASDEIHRTWATIPLYIIATGTGLSRLNDDKHWFSDVVAGAALGFTSAKFVNGRWRVFGLSAPHFLLVHGGAGFSMSLPMPVLR
ncbi:MAG TPA: phosphatase PAP2 family protein [Gemmatimonadales bacterium]|nr:phosphatase PAP2 family protein [Gemmatimonadales bacterium]